MILKLPSFFILLMMVFSWLSLTGDFFISDTTLSFISLKSSGFALICHIIQKNPEEINKDK